MKQTLFALVSVVILFAFGCQNTPTTTTVDAGTSTAEDPKKQPEVYLYHSLVNNLLIREQPNKQGKTLSQIPHYEIVESAGELSTNKEKATLLGTEWEEPYLKVTLLNPEKLTGWAFSPGLKCVYAGSRTSMPNIDKLRQFTGYLANLPAKSLESSQKAWAYVRANFKDSEGPLADAVALILENYISMVAYADANYEVLNKVEISNEDYQKMSEGKLDLTQNPVTKPYAEAGMCLGMTEGSLYAMTDWRLLKSFFGNKATPAMGQFIDFQKKETQMPASDDGGLVITLEELADRAAAWEKFGKDYPHFVDKSGNEYLKEYKFTLLVGMNNTPAFDYETSQVSEEVKKSWEYIFQKYPATDLAKDTKYFADLVAAEGGKRTEKVEAYIQKLNGL